MCTRKWKVFSGIMAVLLVVSFGACSQKNENLQLSDTLTPTENVATEIPDTETPTPEATPGNEDALQVRGTWSGNVYTNTFLGLTYTLPENWMAASDEDILAIMGLGSEMLGNENELEKALAKQQTIYDFMVQDSGTSSNISISFENLSLTLGGILYSEKDYANAVALQLQAMEEMEYTVGAYEDVTIADKAYLKVPTSLTYQGVTIQQNYYLRKENKFMICMIITCGIGETQDPDQFLGAFAKAEAPVV